MHEIQAKQCSEEYLIEIDILVNRYRDATGPLMKLANFAGSKIESVMEAIPDGFEKELQNTIKLALEKAYDTSDYVSNNAYAPTVPSYFHKVTATVTGAIGGLAGLAGAVAELPVSVTTMFGSFQKIAESYGFDRSDPETKIECLKVFSMGGPLEEDDDLDLSFVTAKLGLSGQVVSNIIATASQRLSVVITQKLGSSAIPILGAVSGGALNYAFISYYEEMAHIRFRLKQLGVEYSDVNPIVDFVAKLRDRKQGSSN